MRRMISPGRTMAARIRAPSSSRIGPDRARFGMVLLAAVVAVLGVQQLASLDTPLPSFAQGDRP
jgi:hypothetical protein